MSPKIEKIRGEKITLSLGLAHNQAAVGTKKDVKWDLSRQVDFKITKLNGDVIHSGQVNWEGAQFWVSHPHIIFDRYIKIDIKYNNQQVVLEYDQKYNNYEHLSNFYTEEEIEGFNYEKPKKLAKGSTDLVFSSPFDHIEHAGEDEEARRTVVFLSYGHGQGDALLFEPTLRKLSQSLNRKISVVTKRPEMLFNHPCIEDLFLLDTPSKQYCKRSHDIFRREKNFDVVISRPNINIPFRWAAYAHTERSAHFLGFCLRKDERNMKFFPIKNQDYSFLKNYVVCSINLSSPIRFWSFDKWNKLFSLLNKHGIKVAVIGTPNLPAKDLGHVRSKFRANHSEDLDMSNVLDLTYKTVEENYNIIDSCKALVTTDTASQHLCGATDTWLFLLGTAVHPEVTMPWRQGSQEYKAVNISGDCVLYCSSNLSYSYEPDKVFSTKMGYKRTNASSYALVDDACLEHFDEPSCHPQPEKVFKEVFKIYK